MTRRFYNTKEQIYSVWLAQTHVIAENGIGSLTVKEEDLYSYDVKIAKLSYKTGYVLLNVQKYCHTTTVHQMEIEGIIPPNVKKVHIEGLKNIGKEENVFEISKVIEAFSQTFFNIITSLLKARKPQKYVSKLWDLCEELSAYLGYLGKCDELQLYSDDEFFTLQEAENIKALCDELAALLANVDVQAMVKKKYQPQ